MKRISNKFSPIDYDLRDHPKAMRAGVYAMGVWLHAMLTAGASSSDGDIDETALRFAFGERVKPEAIRKLVAVGLLVKTERGFHIHNYENKCPTKKDIESMRSAAAERVKKYRESRSGNADVTRYSGVTNTDVTRNTDVSNAFVSLSVSTSVSSQDQGEQGEGAGRGGTILPPANDSSPDLETVARIDAETRYRQAYERGIADGKKSPYAMPGGGYHAAALHQAILVHARWTKGPKAGQAVRGDDLLAWIEAFAHDFAADVTDWSEKDPKQVAYFSSYGPKGFIRWLNERRTKREAREVG